MNCTKCDALTKRIKELEAAVRLAQEYFEDNQDIEDHPNGGQIPDERMQLNMEMKQALGLDEWI